MATSTMTTRPRVVLDTNVLISAVITPTGTPMRVLRWVLDRGVLLTSEATLSELADRFVRRSKFDRYLAASGRLEFVAEVDSASEHVQVTSRLAVCSDPDDDRFAELVIDGRADALVTGNTRDFPESIGGVPVLTPAAFAADHLP